jgi:hypothetical protein
MEIWDLVIFSKPTVTSAVLIGYLVIILRFLTIFLNKVSMNGSIEARMRIIRPLQLSGEELEVGTFCSGTAVYGPQKYKNVSLWSCGML